MPALIGNFSTRALKTDGIAGTVSMPRIPHFKEIIGRSPLVFVIGVAGDSGSGKTTFTNAIRQIFGPDLVATITLDDYHRYNREERKRLDITPLHPDANNLVQLETDVERLRDGRAITKPVYNHETGTFDPPVPFASKKIIILEGLHTLFTPRLRELMDFSVFVDPDAEVRYAWKRRRDTGERGYSPAEVTEEITRREKDYETLYRTPALSRRCRHPHQQLPGTGKRKGKRKISTGSPSSSTG